MKAYTMIELDHDEIQSKLPYAVIGETASRAIWNTGKRKRLWASTFTESEMDTCNEIIRKAKKWLLVSGCPDREKMRTTTYALWLKLADFCASL